MSLALERLLAAIADASDDDALPEIVVGELRIVAPTALARATALRAWKAIWDREHGVKRGGDRRSRAFRENQSENFSFWSVASKELPLGKRAMELDVALSERLGVEATRILWDTHVADNAVQLNTISYLLPPQRAWLWEQIRADKTASFATWMRCAGLRAEQDSEEQKFNCFAAMWKPASRRLKLRILDHVGVPPALANEIIARWEKRAKSNNTRTEKTAA